MGLPEEPVGRLRPEIWGTCVPEAQRQVGSLWEASLGWSCTFLGVDGRRASEASGPGVSVSLCASLTHPLSLKAALVCWCLWSCHTQGPG